MLLFSYSHEICSTQGIQDMVRSLSLLPVSATLKNEIYVSRISGYVLKVRESAPIGHFRGPSSKNPHFQNEARCTIFLVKMSFICIADHLPSFWNRGPGELGNSLLSLLPLLVFRFLVALLTHPSSLLFLISRAFSSSRHSSSSSSLSPSAFTFVASLLIDRDLPVTLLVLSFLTRWCKWGDCS